MGIVAERSFSIGFDDGSLVCIVATGRGDDMRGVQELIEARRGSLTVRLDDLWRMVDLRAGRARRRRTLWRDKGHRRMYREALRRLERGEPAAYPARDLAIVGTIQIAAVVFSRTVSPGGKSLLESAASLTSVGRALPMSTNMLSHLMPGLRPNSSRRTSHSAQAIAMYMASWS